MSGGIRNFIKKHEKLEVIYTAFSRINDEDFRHRVLGISWKSFECRDNGPDKKEGVVYTINIGSTGEGFFAEHRRMLNYLYYCAYFNMIPYISYSKNYLYAEDHPVNGTDNPYEYYYEQPCISQKEVADYRLNVTNRDVDAVLANSLKPNNGYDLSEQYVDSIAEICRKYIRYNAVTKSYLDDNLKKVLQDGKKTIGVHVRLTDFKKNYFGHPICVMPEDYIEHTKAAIEKYGFEKVFLATDDLSTIEMFKKEFGDKLSYYEDVVRSSGEQSVAFSDSERENHHYLLGLEVLRDMYTLSRCNGLVAGKSQVSICALIYNRLETPYEVCDFIDLGRNSDRNVVFSDTLQEK